MFEKNQEAESKAAHAEELSNFKNMLLENVQPRDGKIKSDKWKRGSGKCCKGTYKSKTHVYNNIDEFINKYYFSFNADLKSQSQQTNKKLFKSRSR